jgi:hypothetical protein
LSTQEGNSLIRFFLSVIDQAYSSGTAEEFVSINQFNSSIKASGNFVMAAGIAGPDTAQLVDYRDENQIVEQKSIFNTQDFVSGFWIIDALDQTEALEIAKRASFSCNRRVELRQFLS